MSSVPNNLVVSPRTPQTPIIDQRTGQMAWEWVKFFQNAATAINNGLNILGEFIGSISATTKIAGRTEGIGTTVQHINSSGVVQAAGMAAAAPGVQGSVSLPVGALSNALGTASLSAKTDFDSAGSASTAQSNAEAFASDAANITTGTVSSLRLPAVSTLSGIVSPAQLPAPTTTTFGGVQANTPIANKWVSSISASGVPQLSQPAFIDISGNVGAAQLPTNVPVISYGTGAPISASTEGYIYFDTSLSPFQGYVYHNSTWNKFS